MIQERFDHQNIIEVKHLLSNLGVEIEKTDGRRIFANRSALEADVLDLMDGLQSLYHMHDLNPKITLLHCNKFTSLDCNKFPKLIAIKEKIITDLRLMTQNHVFDLHKVQGYKVKQTPIKIK